MKTQDRFFCSFENLRGFKKSTFFFGVGFALDAIAVACYRTPPFGEQILLIWQCV
jgi:hypothetical protein